MSAGAKQGAVRRWIPVTACLALVGLPAAPSALAQGCGGPAASAAEDARAMEGVPPMAHEIPSPGRLGALPPETGILAGQPAPRVRVLDAENRPVLLQDAVESGPVLLVFYRGGWCPFCNFQIRELVEAYPEFRRRGVTPVAISVDRPEESARTEATYAIPFPVLSDPDLAAHRAFRVMHHADEAEIESLRGMGMDLEASSGRTHHTIAIPAVFLIDGGGVVRWAHADIDYRVRPSTAQILAVIDRLDLATAGRQ